MNDEWLDLLVRLLSLLVHGDCKRTKRDDVMAVQFDISYECMVLQVFRHAQ